VSLIARHLEENGTPTMILGSALDIMQAARPPRMTFLDYPLGHSAGRPGDKAEQLAVVRAALAGFDATREEQVKSLHYRWSENDDWRQQATDTSSGDQRQPRDETPRYQLDADRQRAKASQIV
jgi:hypothetical protein